MLSSQQKFAYCLPYRINQIHDSYLIVLWIFIHDAYVFNH